MSDDLAGQLHVTSESDIVAARRQIREFTRAMGFGITDVTRIVTAGSELTRNLYQYAASGTVQWKRIEANERVGVELTFQDNGPGIASIEEVMQEGYTTDRGMGMGLRGSKRLMDEMEIDSEVGKGTTVVIRKWLRRS
jgi:serine/threonine-protein kinase RsbT